MNRVPSPKLVTLQVDLNNYETKNFTIFFFTT